MFARRFVLSVTTTAPPAPAQPANTSVTTVVEPKSGWRAIRFRELWHYRELLWILSLRDIKVRYQQTILGAAWTVLQPLAYMLVFVAFFGGNAPKGVPPAIFFFCGLLPFQLFASTLSQASNSLVDNQNLITKVYFPRLVVPIASSITAMIDFCVALVVLLAMMALYRVVPTPRVLLLPAFVLMGAVAALGIGLWLSALNVEYRDVRQAVPALVQFCLFLSPVLYPIEAFPTGWKHYLLIANPLSGVVQGIRWCLLDRPMSLGLTISSASIALGLLVTGLYYFRRMEDRFADMV
jgi:lipopolysaccharide transport system permease protein